MKKEKECQSNKGKQKRIRPTANERKPLAEFVRGADENNLAEFPLALLSDAAPPNQKTLEFQDKLKDWKTGQEITRRVCVTGSDMFGLPTAKDDQVLAALLQLTGIANNFTSPEVHFTKHQIIELLGWDNSGWAYDRVEESLHRWKGVSVHYWNAWRDHEKGMWTDTEAVGVIDYFKLSDGRRTQAVAKRLAQSRFVWNRELFQSFQAGYMKPLDFGFYRRLKRPAAKRAYRFLDKRFYHGPDLELDFRTFACEKLGFSRNYDTGQLKARVRPAMGELENGGYIKPISFRKVRPGDWVILISKLVAEHRNAPSLTTSEPSQLLEQLITRGVAKPTANSLIRDFLPEKLEEKIQYVDWLTARKDKRAPTNSAGFLVAAIRNDYPLPKDYLKAQGKRQSAAVARPIAVPQTPEREFKYPIDDFLATLTPEQRLELETAAVEAADHLTADGYHRSKAKGGQAFTAYQRIVIERYLAKDLVKPTTT